MLVQILGYTPNNLSLSPSTSSICFSLWFQLNQGVKKKLAAMGRSGTGIREGGDPPAPGAPPPSSQSTLAASASTTLASPAPLTSSPPPPHTSAPLPHLCPFPHHYPSTTITPSSRLWSPTITPHQPQHFLEKLLCPPGILDKIFICPACF